MGRRRSAVVIVLTIALVIGAAAAFVQAQVLKAERPPLRPLRFDERLEPGCGCERAIANLPVRLDDGQPIDAAIVDDDERPVRTLASGALRGGGVTTFRWSGRDDAGAPVPDGDYRLRVDLSEPDRSIVVPRPIRVRREAP